MMWLHANGGISTMPAAALFASLFLLSLGHCISLGDRFAAGARGLDAGDLHRRDNNPEHVVLSDCRDKNAVLSSQMAYFANSPNGSPQDVAVVSTPSGQSRLWAGATTTGLFTDTGVSFKATLGPQGADGSYAGNGTNGYGTFSCWQIYQLNLYQYDSTTCSMVYDCDHRAAPCKCPLNIVLRRNLCPLLSGTDHEPSNACPFSLC